MEGSALRSLLESLDRSQLEAVLLDIVAGDERLETPIMLAILRRTRPHTTTTVPVRLPPPDLRALRREAQSNFRNYGVDGLNQLVVQAEARVATSDAMNALAMLEIITDEYARSFENTEDDSDDLGSYFEDLGEAWIEALLAADLTLPERNLWIEKLEEFSAVSSDYGYEESFGGAIVAARHGWDHPPLQRILGGEQSEPDESTAEPAALTIARLNILERQGRNEEALNLARAAGQTVRYATFLVQLGRIDEAVEYAGQQLETADEALAVSTSLRERGEIERAMAIGEQGLRLQGPRVRLATWLRDLTSEQGKAELALRAALAVFDEALSLEAYLRVKELAGEGWSEQRPALLERLRRVHSYYPVGHVDIFLHEGLIDDAIAAVADGATHTLVERVADAAIGTHPEWVVEVSRRQAASIMDPGKAQYYASAAVWLRRARDAYRCLGQENTWQTYRSELLELHGRKYKLVPMIKAL